MSYGGIIRFSDVWRTSETHSNFKDGCIVDTSILFAATYPQDEFNTPAEELFVFLRDLEIPVFANQNIRAEFLDLHRRVAIPEALVSLYSSHQAALHPILAFKLKSLDAKAARKRNEEDQFKFSEHEIKTWAAYFDEYSTEKLSGWNRFCEDFLSGRFSNLWEDTCQTLGINFLDLRGEKLSPWLVNEPDWTRVEEYVGRFGLGSFDAMTLDLFLCSRFSSIVCADRELALAVEDLAPDGKFVIVPSRLKLSRIG